MNAVEEALIYLINTGLVSDKIRSRDDSEYLGWDWYPGYDRAEVITDHSVAPDGTQSIEFKCVRGYYWVLSDPFEPGGVTWLPYW